MKSVNLPSAMIQSYIQFILENSSIYIEKVDDILKKDALRLIYESYAEYNPFGYKYVNQNKKDIHINPDPLSEYENKQFRERAVLEKFRKIKQNKILNELPQLKDNTIYIRTFENVKSAIETSTNRKFKGADELDDYIENFALLYFPDITRVSLEKAAKFKISEEEVDIIQKNILLDNFREEYKEVSASYADQLLTYGKENYLYTDVTTYLKRRNQTESIDLLYIFNAIDLNKPRKYQIAMASLTDPINNQTIYKIYNPLWNNLNSLEETINMSKEKSISVHTQELLLNLIKYIKVAVNKDTISPVPSKPNGLLYKFMLDFYINSFDKIYSGVVEKKIRSGDYDIYELNIGHKKLSIIDECIINSSNSANSANSANKKVGDSINVGDSVTFVPFEALSIRSFALTLQDDYKVGLWTYGTRYSPIQKQELVRYYKAANEILKEINGYYDNYRKQVILFPNKVDFSRNTFKLNDMYVHKHMKLPCIPDETGECNDFSIDLELLKSKFIPELFPEFELDDRFYVGDIIYYSTKSQTKKGQIESVVSEKEYMVRKLGSRKKGAEKIDRKSIYGVQDGESFQINMTYKQVNNFKDLPIIEKKIKYYLEKKTPSDVIVRILKEEYPEADIDNVYEDFIRNYKSILSTINTGIKVTLDFTNLINGVENIDQFDIYVEHVYNINHLPFIYQSIKIAMFSYFTSKYTIEQLKSIGFELPANWNRENGKYVYRPQDKELLAILRSEKQREIQRRMQQKIYDDDDEGNEGDGDEGDGDEGDEGEDD